MSNVTRTIRNPWVPLVLATVVLITLLPGNETALSDEGNSSTKAESLSDSAVEEMLEAVSNWGRWGKNDELGTLNLITPETRRRAASLVKDGVSVSMGHDLIKEPFDDSEPFEHEIMMNVVNQEVGGAGDRYSIQYHGFAHTHIDALCHIFWKDKMYNGFGTENVAAGQGRASIKAVKDGIFTRGVLMDMPALFGVRYLQGDQAIRPAHLEAWEQKTGMRVTAGDAVLIRTGRWTRRENEGPWRIMQNSAGLHVSCLKWLHERNVAIVGSDLALDVMPSGSVKYELPVHLGVIVQMGMCILDCLDYRAVATECRERQTWEFLLTVAPLRVEGGTGSPVNPIATF
jgi:kynurenine formamidase